MKINNKEKRILLIEENINFLKSINSKRKEVIKDLIEMWQNKLQQTNALLSE
jgi:hypothetical protein